VIDLLHPEALTWAIPVEHADNPLEISD